MKTYKAVLFAPDGDWVTDYKGETKDEVVDQLIDRGSRWLFYPLEGIILDKGAITTSRQRVVDMAPPLRFLTGKPIKFISKWIKRNQDTLCIMLDPALEVGE
jgi:hypothetical protein